MARYDVESGVTGTGVILNLDSMYVSSGGTANSTTVNAGGTMYVSNGGSANSTTVNSGGTMFVSKAATATGIMVNQGGSCVIAATGLANGITLASGGEMTVSSGGIAANIVENGGYLYLNGDAVATFVSNSFSNLVLFSNSASVHSGTTAFNTLVTSDSLFNVCGGFASNTTVANNGCVYVQDGGTASHITFTNGGSVCVKSGGVANSTTLDNGGHFEIESGGTANNTTINSGGISLDRGGTANNTTINSGGISLDRGGTLNGTIVNSGAGLTIMFGDVSLNNTTVNNGGTLRVMNGNNSVINTTIHSGATFSLYAGTANSTTVNGFLRIHNAVTNNTTVNSGGTQAVVLLGTANNTTVNDGGLLQVFFQASGTTVNSGGLINVSGFASMTTVNTSGSATVTSGGTAFETTVSSGGILSVSAGGRLTGSLTMAAGADVTVSGTIVFDITQATAGVTSFVNDLSLVKGTPIYSLTVSDIQAEGTYNLAEGAAGFNKTISVVNTEGGNLGTLSVGQTVNVGGSGYTLNLGNDNVLSITVGAAVAAGLAKSDIDGNGISDVMFVWTGNNYQHGYWMNGTSEWLSAGSNHPAEWDNLGCYDMTGDGKADSVLFGNVTTEAGIKGAYIGYYADANDLPDGSTWVNIGYLNNADDIDWKNKVGNLTGNASGVNSIVWYAPELYALGAWTDGTETWVTLSNTFGGDAWTLVGCGDFDGDGKDSVLMTYNGGQMFYAVGIGDAEPRKMGSANWSGWDVRAIGDFSGDKKDDLVLFHKDSGSMVMFADGNVNSYTSIGQLDASDWFVVGAGDYNGDAKDDLLVRQYSTGMLGYYSAGDTSQWVELGRGVDMDWTVIA